jgi:hypothetical protein
MTGYQSKRAMAQDKLVVTDIDGHVVRDARKPKKAQPAQEPVAWYHNDFGVVELSRIPRAGWKPLTTPLQPAQKPVAWLEPEWGEKICPEVGYEVTMTDDHPKDLGWIPLYPHPPQGEIVAYLVLFEGAGKLLEFTKGNYIHGAKVEHVPLYTNPPQRPWVDLTPQNLNEIFAIARTGEHAVRLASDKLKEKNNGT